jgi:hypothetical protein
MLYVVLSKKGHLTKIKDRHAEESKLENLINTGTKDVHKMRELVGYSVPTILPFNHQYSLII